MQKWFALVLLVSFAGSASAEETRFKLINGTKYGIRGISLSPQDLGFWRPNVLQPPPIKPGEAREVVFTSDFRDCNQDLKVVFTDRDDQPIWGHLNLCDLRKIRLNYDAMSGITTAAYEE
jgi:hypothetical protein